MNLQIEVESEMIAIGYDEDIPNNIIPFSH